LEVIQALAKGEEDVGGWFGGDVLLAWSCSGCRRPRQMTFDCRIK
jgi:hypothetical protein